MTQDRTEVNLGAGSDLEFLRNLLHHSDEIGHEALIAQVFSPENLDRLLRVQEQNPGADVLLTEACKTQKIPIGKLEQALTQRQKAVREAEANAKAQELRQQFHAVPGGIELPLPTGCAIPKGYVVRPGETSVADADMGKLIIAPAGLAVLTRYRDIESGLTQVQIGAWADGATQWHTIEVPRKTIFDTHAVVELANYDFPVSSLSAKAVVEYFVQFETKNRQAIPEKLTTSHLGWQTLPHGKTLGFLAGPDTFVPVGDPGSDLRFLPENPGDSQVAEGFTSKGALDAWIAQVAAPLLGYPKATLGLLAAFGTPLLKILHHPNFVLDYSGTTSLGKTTTQRAAGSVWGAVDEAEPAANVIQSWNATQVGASEMGRILTGLPLILDDSKTARSEKSVAEILYLVVNGKGRAKGAKAGGLRATATTKTILISSGEKPITHFSHDGGTKTRTLIIEGSPFGAVSEATRTLVQALTNTTIEHHGAAGPAWIAWVIAHQADWPGWLDAYRQRKEQRVALASSPGQGRLVAHRAFLESIGGLVGQAFPALRRDLEALVGSAEWDGLWGAMTAEAGDPLDGQQALRMIGSWAQSHIEQFEGQRSENSYAPNEWLGKWESNTVALLKHAVDDRLREQGYDPQAIIAQWRAEGWLKSGEGRNADPKTTISGQRGRNAYVLSDIGLAIALADDNQDDQDTAANSEDPTDDDYVPF